MISYSQARYIVTEISRIPFYQQMIAEYQAELTELKQKKESLSEPKSPNGKTSIGEGRGNEVTDFSNRLLDLIVRQDELEQEQYNFVKAEKRAEAYLEILLKSHDAEYAEAYFHTRDKRELHERFAISNAYDRMIRVVRNNIRRL